MTLRVLVTGAAGVVGSAISPRFADAYPGCVFVDRDVEGRRAVAGPLIACDLESRPDVRALVDRQRPDVVVHLAGNKDVFALQKSPETARRANVDTTRNLAEALGGRETQLVLISSDYVFEGTMGPYRESSPTRPRTEYGKSKVGAEQLLLASGLPVAIARSASLFGFDGDFISLVRTTLAAGREFVAFSDLVSNPTAIGELFEMLRRIIDGRKTGIFHTAGGEALSRAAFARRVAIACSLDVSLIREARRDEQIRPSDLSLDNSATYAALAYVPTPLDPILRGSLGRPSIGK